MARSNDCPENCFQGSTDFYDSSDTDQFTPSNLEAGPLIDNVGSRRDGTLPPWIDPSSRKSPIEQYVEWFNGIWHLGDPSGWNASVFTAQAVMIDPSGISQGAQQAASSFLLLFKYYPDLRGEVVSWAANEREIFINWRFRILPRGSKIPVLVAVSDKFCFIDGRVSFRLANFDVITLTGYLSEYFGQNQLFDFLSERFWQAQRTGGLQLLPQMLWHLLKGMFLWPQPPEPTGLSAFPGDGVVSMNWSRIVDAIGYEVCRSMCLEGPYESVAETKANAYDDVNVANGTPYWYLIKPKYAKFKATPVVKGATFRRPQAEQAISARVG